MSDHDPLCPQPTYGYRCPRCDQIARVRADEAKRNAIAEVERAWAERADLRAKVEALPRDWYSFIHPTGNTSHIGLFYADGSTYVPEPDATGEDMLLAAAADRCWPLVRLPDVLALIDGSSDD